MSGSAKRSVKLLAKTANVVQQDKDYFRGLICCKQLTTLSTLERASA